MLGTNQETAGPRASNQLGQRSPTWKDGVHPPLYPRSGLPAASRRSEPTARGMRPLGTSDRHLVAAIVRGDSEAAAPLYSLLRPGIESALTRVLRDRPAEFDDLIQITFERVIRSIAEGGFEGRSQLKTWASAIAAHVAVDYLRRRSFERKLFEALDTVPRSIYVHNSATEQRLEARSEARRVQGALERMKPRRAAILVLHDMLGHSVPQVADRLGIKASAAQSTLRRARQELLRRCTATSLPSEKAL